MASFVNSQLVAATFHSYISYGDSDDYIYCYMSKDYWQKYKYSHAVPYNASRGLNFGITSGAGNDTIISSGYVYASINAGAGDDIIIDGSTVIGGHGNDTVSGSEFFIYNEGDGNDIVLGCSHIKIASGTYFTQVNDNDVIIKVGDGSITLKDAKDKLLNIEGTFEEPILNETISNSINDTLINLGAGDDSVYNYHATNVTLETGNGNDSVYNYFRSNFAEIIAGDGDDSVHNWSSSSVTINTGNGNDTVYNDYNADNGIIETGTGDDSVHNWHSSNLTVDTDLGNDTVYNYNSSEVVITTSDGDDSVSNYYHSDNVSINTGAGNDSVYNYNSSEVVIATSDGDDSVSNYYHSDNVSINTGAGNDSVYNQYSSNVTVDTGLGDDLIVLKTNSNANVIKYSLGDGNDTITGVKIGDTINIVNSQYTAFERDGNVIISVEGGNITLVDSKLSEVKIVGEQALNTMSSSLPIAEVEIKKVIGTDGNDKKYNYDSYVEIQGGKGDDQLVSFAEGDNVSINGGAGNDTVRSWSFRALINGENDNDFLYSASEESTVLAGFGEDTIQNYGRYNLINGESGNNSINNTILGKNSTILSGTGNDTINNDAENVLIYSESGNDLITNQHSSNVTINAGQGNDTINLTGYYSNNVIQYLNGDGHDTIQGYNSHDTIQIFNSSYTIIQSENNIIVNIGNGSITLIDASDKILNICDIQIDTILQAPNSSFINYDLMKSTSIDLATNSQITDMQYTSGSNPTNLNFNGTKNF